MPTIEEIRHSCAHLLASAVQHFYPNVKLGIGPVIDDGFYYDFDLDHTFTPEDFPQFEQYMQELVKKNLPYERKQVTKEEAKKLFHTQPYKLELIEEFSKEGKELTAYKTGDFLDLCRGGHAKTTREIGAFKLLRVAGAYWRGDAKNKQLQRIYATAFPDKKQLQQYLTLLAEAKQRDHRTLGEQLGLFFVHEYSPGAPIFLPKGTLVYTALIQLIRDEYKKRGYQEVITPLLYEKGLWETSGHWEHYKENMFNLESEKKVYSLKPMNCPSHCLVYKQKMWSYKELPLRIADFAPLHRNELSGTLSGLTRVRKFIQDDAHIFLTEDQLEQEIENVLEFMRTIYNDIFKMNYTMHLGTRPENFMGDKNLWDKAEQLLEKILKKKKLPYTLAPGDGAFYGPKIDLRVKDALNREWQLATVQLDFQIPLRFELTYEGSDGRKHTPIMIHRAVYGSIERFFALLIEHYAGKFPVWLAPVQVAIITVADRHVAYAEELKKTLQENNIRVELDARMESIPKKVRDHQKQKVPYTITIGDKELESKQLAIRARDNTVSMLSQDAFLKKIKEEIEMKKS